MNSILLFRKKCYFEGNRVGENSIISFMVERIYNFLEDALSVRDGNLIQFSKNIFSRSCKISNNSKKCLKIYLYSEENQYEFYEK